MNIHIQITHAGKDIPIIDALKNNYIYISEHKILEGNGTHIALSSMLFDCNGREIFEKDFVKTSDGQIYTVHYDYGVFYLSNNDNNSIKPMYLYKLGNSLDVEKLGF